MRHAEDALVDHDQAAALVAVPAEVRLDDGELRIGVGAEPAVVDGECLGDGFQSLLGVELVFGQGEDADAGAAGLAQVFLEAGAANQGEVAQANGRDGVPAAGRCPGLGFPG